MEEIQNDDSEKLLKYLSPRTAWALAVGTAIGWGSFVVTGNTYLLHAGPAGSIIGLLIGMLVMVLIGRNYHYMMNKYPLAGGVYCYTKNLLGHDYGFLTAWFLGLTYIAIFWANATSIPLFARYFLGDFFRFGKLYTLFGNDIYIGEALLTGVAIVLTGILCSKSKLTTARIAFVLVVVLALAIFFCTGAALVGHANSDFSFAPTFIPDKNAFSQTIFIVIISPWAFIGFESISHSAEGFSFPHKKSFSILTLSLVVSTALYIFVIVLSISAYPSEYNGWLEYLKDLGNIKGIKALPPFYAAEHYLGAKGIFILMIVLLSLIITSLIGNMVALSRLIYAVSKDNVIPKKYSHLNKAHVPFHAVQLITVLSILIPFVGRVAIGWIVDVTTIGATIIYGFISYATWKSTTEEKKTAEKRTGFIGMVLMIIFGFLLIVPTPLSGTPITHEALFLFIIWAILGFVVFHHIIKHDTTGKFGNSVVVWIALISFVLIISLIWMYESNGQAVEDAIEKIYRFTHGTACEEDYKLGEDAYMNLAMHDIQVSNIRNTFIVIALFTLSIMMLISNFMILKKREIEHAKEVGKARTIATTDSMTGVKNKHAFTEYENRINGSISSGEEKPFAVVVCDVNGLKHVNDTQGHKAGDEYIRSACRLICQLFKHSPVFRIGGDEFVVIMGSQDYERRTEIMNELNRTVEYNQNNGLVIVAAGMAEFDSEKDSSFASVFERADTLMYERKKKLKGAR